MEPVSADLTSAASLREALGDLRPDTVFFTAWTRQDTEAENIAVNGGMVRNLLAALAHAPLRHVALMTGLKHYLGPFEAYGAGRHARHAVPRGRGAAADAPTSTTPRRTSCSPPRRAQGFTWSVHRAHTIIGHAVGNAMNMGLTLAVAGRDLPRARPAVRLPGLARRSGTASPT